MRKVSCPFCDEEMGEIMKTYSSVTINLSINHIEGDLFECSKCKKQFEASLQLTLVDHIEVSLGDKNA